MRHLIILLFFIMVPFSVWADDIIHATSEDMAEFDQFLANEPALKEKPGKKPHNKMKPNKGDKKPPPPRDDFKGKGPGGKMGKLEGDKPPRKGPPRDDRERRRRRPPPHKKPPPQQ